MSRIIFFSVAAAAATFFGISAASANPIYIGYKIGAGALTKAATGDGSLNYNHTVSNVTFAISATGSPVLKQPDFQTAGITVRNNSGAASTAIKVYVSETNLTAIPDFLTIGFANNGLSTGNVDVAAYVQNCTGGVCGTTIGDDVFATTNLVYSGTVARATGGTATVAFPTTVTGLYNQTLVYTFTLPKRGISNANLSVTGMNVPEPLTLSLFGAGLAGLASTRRRKKQAA